MPKQKVTLNGKTYYRSKTGELWTGEDGNLYDLSTGQPIAITKTAKNYSGFINSLLPDLLKIGWETHVPIVDSFENKGTEVSKDDRSHYQRNADRLSDKDSSNPIKVLKYNLLEDSKEGITNGLKRTVFPAVTAAGIIPYGKYIMAKGIPGITHALLNTGGTYLTETLGKNIGKTVAKVTTKDDQIIDNSKKLGSEIGLYLPLATSSINNSLWKDIRKRVYHYVTPLGYGNSVHKGVIIKQPLKTELINVLKSTITREKLSENDIPVWVNYLKPKKDLFTTTTENGEVIRPHEAYLLFRDAAYRKGLGIPQRKNVEIYIPNGDGTYGYNLDLVNRIRTVKGGKPFSLDELPKVVPGNKTIVRPTGSTKEVYLSGDGPTGNGGFTRVTYDPSLEYPYELYDKWDVLPFKDEARLPNLKIGGFDVAKFIHKHNPNFEVLHNLNSKPFILKQSYK